MPLRPFGTFFLQIIDNLPRGKISVRYIGATIFYKKSALDFYVNLSVCFSLEMRNTERHKCFRALTNESWSIEVSLYRKQKKQN